MSDLTPTDPVIGTPRTRTSGRATLIASAALLVGIGLGVGGTLATQSILGTSDAPEAGPDTRFQDAVDTCEPIQGVTVEDDGATLVIDMKGEDDSMGATYEEESCILQELGVPARVTSHMGQTTSMDGRQSESWDGITVEWSYHPDRGADMVLSIVPAS